MTVLPASRGLVKSGFGRVVRHLPLPKRLRASTPHLLFFGSIALVVLTPLAFAVITGAREAGAYARNPVWPLGQLSLTNFLAVWDEYPLLEWFANSLLLSLGSSIMAIAVSAFAAFGFVTGGFRGHRLLFGGIVALMVVPSVTLIVPLFRLNVQLGLQDTYFAAFLIYSALLVPFSVYLLTRTFETVPHELREAAHMDGARPLKVFVWLYLPLARSAIVVLLIINAVWVWNDLLIALVFLDEEHRTIMAGLAVLNGGMNRLNVPLIFAALVTASIPIVAAYLGGQSLLARGFIQSGVKG